MTFVLKLLVAFSTCVATGLLAEELPVQAPESELREKTGVYYPSMVSPLYKPTDLSGYRKDEVFLGGMRSNGVMTELNAAADSGLEQKGFGFTAGYVSSSQGQDTTFAFTLGMYSETAKMLYADSQTKQQLTLNFVNDSHLASLHIAQQIKPEVTLGLILHQYILSQKVRGKGLSEEARKSFASYEASATYILTHGYELGLSFLLASDNVTKKSCHEAFF